MHVTCPLPGGQVSGYICGMFSDGRELVVYYARSPDHQQTSRMWSRCVSTTSTMKCTRVTSKRSSIGEVMPRQLGCASSSKRASSRDKSIGRNKLGPSQSMPCIVSYTVAIRKDRMLHGI